jgi:hypothetical protein
MYTRENGNKDKKKLQAKRPGEAKKIMTIVIIL